MDTTLNSHIPNVVGPLIYISVVTVAGICNSVGGGVMFDIPPRCRCRWRVQYAPCIAGQSSVPFPAPHASSQCKRQPPLPLLIIRCSTTQRDRRGGRSHDRSPKSLWRWPRWTAHLAWWSGVHSSMPNFTSIGATWRKTSKSPSE